MRVINEIKKLFSIKAIWVIYLLLLAYMVILANDSYWPYQELRVKFVNHHGVGPYSEELINDYQTLGRELESCNNENAIEEACQSLLSERSKELIALYSQSQGEKGLNLNLYSLFRYLYSNDYHEKIASINQTINEEKRILNQTTIEKLFYNKMIDYHELNPRWIDLNNQIYYDINAIFEPNLFKDAYLIVGGFFTVIMLILTISFSFSNDASSTIDYLILSSKTGRKILKYKLASSTITAIIMTLLCIIPLLVIGTITNYWSILFNSKMAVSNLRNWFWFDFSVLQYIITCIIMMILTNIFISIIATIISIYSKKLINAIVYNFVILGSVIGGIIYFNMKGSFNNFTQLIRIILYHTPFGFLFNNASMFEYNFKLESSYLTYREFPFIYSVINIVMISFLFALCYRFYKKMNI